MDWEPDERDITRYDDSFATIRGDSDVVCCPLTFMLKSVSLFLGFSLFPVGIIFASPTAVGQSIVQSSQTNLANRAIPDPDRPTPDQTIDCELLIVGGGLSGTATAYEALLAGRTVCMTEITDWVGGQISSQGTSALDEAGGQRSRLFYSKGYNELRQRIEDHYDILNPGDCWVSAACYLPSDAHDILLEQLDDAEDKGDGDLKWFPSTVIKDLDISEDGRLIEGAIAIQHTPAPNGPELNRLPLSQTIEDAYHYEDSEQFTKNPY